MSPWILVIDDDPWTREALVAILRRAGYRVTTAASFTPELIADADSPSYQVAVVDFHLPSLNGLEVARRLKELQPECRIVMISSEPPEFADSQRPDGAGGPLPGQAFLQGRHSRGHRPTLPHHGRLIQALFHADLPAARLTDWVLNFVRREGLFQPGDRVLVAVSGGPDSVALLHLLAGWRQELGLELGVGHFDHSLRGRESAEDAAFVAELAEKAGLPFHPGRGDVKELARLEKLSVQMAARRLRLDFLQETCRTHGYQQAGPGPHRRRPGGTLLPPVAPGRRPRRLEGHVARHPGRHGAAPVGGGQGAPAGLAGAAGPSLIAGTPAT